jgi:hypothetical protein
MISNLDTLEPRFVNTSHIPSPLIFREVSKENFTSVQCEFFDLDCLFSGEVDQLLSICGFRKSTLGEYDKLEGNIYANIRGFFHRNSAVGSDHFVVVYSRKAVS